MIVATVDVGGSQTTVAITDDVRRAVVRRGPGSPVRPGRAILTATAVAELVRGGLAEAGYLRADCLVVGAAGAGNATDADELRAALVREGMADRVIVTTDVLLALAALGDGPVAILVAGTGSIAIGRVEDGRVIRQGGYGWQMGDEGSGYWIGREALHAAGAAEDGRGPATTLAARLTAAVRGATIRDLVGWSTGAAPREVAGLVPTVATAAADGDAVARAILAAAGEQLGQLVDGLARQFPAGAAVPLGLTGGLIGAGGPLRQTVSDRVRPPFALLPEPVDALLGGPRLAVS